MSNINLPTDLLRTFVTVIEVRNFTRAASLLGRTQPAISLQIKRLEELIGYKLIHQEGRSMRVSEKGEALAMHARQILRLNDMAVGIFERHTDKEIIRIGLPLDYSVRLLQQKLTKLWKENPEQRIFIQCDLSQNLIEALLKDEIDMAVALYNGGDPQFLVQKWQEYPFWVGAKGVSPSDFEELPLVAHPIGCVYRQRMSDALKLVGRSWEAVFTTPDIEALQQAVQDGLGFSCLTASTLREGIIPIPDGAGLPKLEPLQIGLFYRQSRFRRIGNMVTDCLVETIEGTLGKKAAMQSATLMEAYV